MLNEDEILFNPLNFFEIKDQKVDIINEANVILFQLLFAPNTKGLQSLRKYQQEMSIVSAIGNVLVDGYGKIEGCNDYFKKHKQICRNDSDMIANLQMRSLIHEHGGEYSKQLEVLKQRKKKGFKNDLQIATYNLRVGGVYEKMGQYPKSLEYYNICEKIRRQIIGETHTDYATTLNNIGGVYYSMGQYLKSLEYFDKCEKIRRQTLGNNHPDYATILNNIGSVYYSMGQYPKSLEYFDKCEKIRRQTLGNNHPDYAITLNNIGGVYKSMGQYRKSLEYFDKCEKILRQTLGEDHPAYAATLNNIGEVYQSMGQYPKFLEFFAKLKEFNKICQK